MKSLFRAITVRVWLAIIFEGFVLQIEQEYIAGYYFENKQGLYRRGRKQAWSRRFTLQERCLSVSDDFQRILFRPNLPKQCQVRVRKNRLSESGFDCGQ